MCHAQGHIEKVKHFTAKTGNKDRLKKDKEKVKHFTTKTGNKDRLKKDIENILPQRQEIKTDLQRT